MTAWTPAPEYARLKNGQVQSVAPGSCTVLIDGGMRAVNGVPVYGSVAVGQYVLVLDQGSSLLVIGKAPLIGYGTLTFTYDGTWHRADLSGLAGHGTIRGFAATPWGIGQPLAVSIVDADPANFGVGIWRVSDHSKVTTDIPLSVIVAGSGHTSLLDGGPLLPDGGSDG